MRRIISAKVRNSSGVLNRVSGVLTRRQFNIESISVGVTEKEGISRITFVMVGSSEEVEQVLKQLNKQIDVLKVVDLTEVAYLERELALVRVNAPTANRSELFALIEPFRASVIDVGSKTILIQVTGTSDKVDAFVELVKPYGIKELARTGVTGLARSL
ncbi:acetolactate synthase small subunit [Vagococcus elongatus]|uniref:Acetolactate synthase small subunit n=1 Tax=Vagococcus elongatus TaxID=180344 RepID=A0A430AQC6_9ENTE|nr:acetolactate synthase small subunit [Vagococcus elongatus]RSU10319.1 acetolactate synthase small subunit [Vagococcus elongatus]